MLPQNDPNERKSSTSTTQRPRIPSRCGGIRSISGATDGQTDGPTDGSAGISFEVFRFSRSTSIARADISRRHTLREMEAKRFETLSEFIESDGRSLPAYLAFWNSALNPFGCRLRTQFAKRCSRIFAALQKLRNDTISA